MNTVFYSTIISLLNRCPENSKVKHKMVYASSKDYLKKTLKVVPELQATDEDELTLANLTEKYVSVK